MVDLCQFSNVTALTDASGTVIERYVYTPYGDVTIYDSTWTNTRNSSSFDNTILYTGHELDPETGLYNYRARWYHAGLGTFTTRDPLGFSAGDANFYRYVGGNPISRTDPSGMLVEEPTIYYGSGYTECPFGAFDGRAPAGYDVQIPGGSEFHVPQYGILVLTPWCCPECGDVEFSGGLFDPFGELLWTPITFIHFHLPDGYSPGPSFGGLWLELWWDNLTGGNEGSVYSPDLRKYATDPNVADGIHVGILYGKTQGLQSEGSVFHIDADGTIEIIGPIGGFGGVEGDYFTANGGATIEDGQFRLGSEASLATGSGKIGVSLWGFRIGVEGTVRAGAALGIKIGKKGFKLDLPAVGFGLVWGFD